MDTIFEERVCTLIRMLDFSDVFAAETAAILNLPYIFEDNETAKRLGIKDLRITSFAEMIAISIPLSEREALDKILKIVSALIRTLLSEFGLTVRGGISVGKLYHDELNVFGPALQKSQKLETEYAIYPRVVAEESDISRALSFCSESSQQMIFSLMPLAEDGLRELDCWKFWSADVVRECIDLLRRNHAKAGLRRRDADWLMTRLNDVLQECPRTD